MAAGQRVGEGRLQLAFEKPSGKAKPAKPVKDEPGRKPAEAKAESEPAAKKAEPKKAPAKKKG